MAFRNLGKRCLRPLSPRERPRRPARFASLRDNQQLARSTGCHGLLNDQPENCRVLRLKLGLHKSFETVPGDELPVPRKPRHHEGEQPRVVGARPGRVEKQVFEIWRFTARPTVEEHPDPCPIPLDTGVPGPEFPGAGVGMGRGDRHANMIPQVDSYA